MEETDTITRLMEKSHQELEELLGKFKSNLLDNFELASEAFEEFKRELEKHLSIEENAIFKFFNPAKDEDYNKVVPDLMKEHDLLLEMLNNVNNDLAVKKDIDISDFEKLLVKHKKFEEEFFYPKMEKDLEDFQRDIVIARIKEGLFS